MKFKDKCKIPHLAWHNLMQSHRLRANWLENNSAEKDQAILINNKLNMSQCALAVKADPYHWLPYKRGKVGRSETSPLLEDCETPRSAVPMP